MRLNLVFATALGLAALAPVAPAHAAVTPPVVVVTPGAWTSSGVALDGPASVQASRAVESMLGLPDTSTSTVSQLVKRVVVAPTATTAGLAQWVEVSTTTTTTTDHFATYDQFSLKQSLTGNTANPEFITFSATVTASQFQSGWLSLNTSGSYVPISSPFGNAVPALPSFFLRTAGSGTWTALQTNQSVDTPSSTFWSSAWQSLSLAAGSTTIEVATWADSAVNLSSFSLSLESGNYNARDVVQNVSSVTTETIKSSELLAPIPEPETYALFAAGLMFVVLRARAQRP
ncbi:PEP-CTERM sorting domain-containing protein [Pelomonas baiyunensis]|uniref:PEP-CTERM sorting domain-containing protein n=1 Tax=Pelomonas baiyunensis TaxID=3299026 RepID=A0ABW7GZ76_9BURK